MRRLPPVLLLLIAFATAIVLLAGGGRLSLALPSAIERVSVDSAGNEGNSYSSRTSISDDERFVVFTSAASDLVPDDTNGVTDVFVHERQTGKTTWVSVEKGVTR